FEPYAYIDENNQPAGYDVAVLKAIDERLPQYEFVFESLEFKNLLLGVDAGKLDIASQQFETNPEREAKYLFTTEGFANYDKRIVVKKGRTDIKSIDDLAGKRVSVGSGSNSAAILEKYNAEHPDTKIEIIYRASSQVDYDNLVNDRADAAVMTRRVFNRTNEAFGGGLGIVEENLFSKSDAYFILAKKETRLRDDIDAALRELKKDGTLTKISIQYTGGDYTAE
ncbi:MAG: transporter substrate-binding domain-containing protein, partial [Synergistaceae bacterium]|nr:transporter substrate-binding domain-containing protein [Synergistaceae bacterium]